MADQSRTNGFLLPVHDRSHVGLTTYDTKDPETAFPPITEVRPPDGAPNVLIILLDDIGFGAASTFGGAIHTPTADRLGSSRQEASIPMLFSGDETLDLGGDHATSVSDDYTPDTSRFTGTVNWVQLDQGVDDHSHLISPEDRLRVAMGDHRSRADTQGNVPDEPRRLKPSNSWSIRYRSEFACRRR
jgi:hypothetical protein